MHHYEELLRFEREGFDIIVDKTWEDIALRDCFDDSCYDIQEMEQKVDAGLLDWFMLRVRVLFDGLEMGSGYLGGCLYEDAQEVIRDGTAEDVLQEAIEQARQRVRTLRDRLDRFAI